VIGWLVLRGHCRHCGSAIHPRYLLMELAVGALTAGVVLLCLDPASVPAALGHAPWQAPWLGAPWLMKSGWPAWLVPALSAAALLTLVWYLLVASIIDLEHTIIPDELSKGMQLLAPALAVCTCNCAIDRFPIDWLVRLNEIGHATPTPGVFTFWLVGIVGGAALLLGLSESCLRLVYERFMAPNEPWTADDTRGVVVGVRWFQAVIGLWTAVTLLIAWSLPGVAGLILAMQLCVAVFGMLVGWWSLYLVGLLGTVAFRRNAMGFGDVKLLAPLGAFLGPFGVLYALAFASILGSAVGLILLALRRTVQIPFGPYLALGAFVAMAIAPAVHAWLLAPLLR
jgi:prepilin signal peptidase PulO-like enzyme (type II secretory pathway)